MPQSRASFAVVLSWWLLACHTAQPPADSTEPVSQYVGQASCASCHVEEARRWSKSDHARAMQHAAPGNVLGDFDQVTFSSPEISATFFRRDQRFFVRTAGPDGVEHEYAIEYCFGVDPLQQYLIALPGGRMQAFTLAWDTRPKDQGGQRWFNLYPGQSIQPGDPLHWSGRDQNWNFMCASCHSTNLDRNYDLERDAYNTTWSELNVSCEACHGPGAAHVTWARAGRDRSAESNGLVRPLTAARSGGWGLIGDRAIASWLGPPRKKDEVEACAPCHARRRELTNHIDPAKPFLDSYTPAGLEDPQYYYADGQVRGEVFEYGSFLQSKMQGAGVTCSDCHDPHSTELRRPEGNNTCTSCHRPSVFDTYEHHHHAPDSAAAQCVTCHMPQRTFMQVDKRRDHSFRVPRPELNNIPNPCTECHANKPSTYASDAIANWRSERKAPAATVLATHTPPNTTRSERAEHANAMPARQLRDTASRVGAERDRHANATHADRLPNAAHAVGAERDRDANATHADRLPNTVGAVGAERDRDANATHADRLPNAVGAVGAERDQDANPMGARPLGSAAHAIAAGRAGDANAERLLTGVALETQRPAIVRASALTLLSGYATSAALPLLQHAVADPDPLVRAAAARTLEALPPTAASQLGAALLDDPSTSVRIEAARALLDVPNTSLTPPQQQQLTAATSQLIAAELASAERPEAHLNLSTFYLRMNQPDAARAALNTALRLDPKFTPALVGLADIAAQRGDDSEAHQQLQHALALAPDDANAHFALGLLHARQGETARACEQLAAAATLQPETARYAQTYALALQETGRSDEATQILIAAQAKHPADRDLLNALINLLASRGDLTTALDYATQLNALTPNDPQTTAWLRQLTHRAQLASHTSH